MAWDMIQPGARVGVLRGTDTVDVVVSENLIKQIVTKGKDYVPMTMRVPVYAAKVMNGEPAAAAGIAPGDRILTVGADTVPTITEFLPALKAHAGDSVTMRLVRADGTPDIVTARVSDAGKIGIQMLSPTEIFDRQTVNYSLLQSVPRGWEIGTDRLVSYVSSLKLVFTKEGAQSLGGFGTLGDLFPARWSWYSFWQITAFLSIILAFMNIIPIPGLDGGHTLFLLVEMVTRRKPSDRFLEIVNTCGFVFLLLLLVYANGNDIYRFFIK
ncbi:MAG: site-2 protease family protein [Muribaculaceae bacterium]|nr:site-2 protease family protein [Muribaculaceae bacterium]